jgi:hypothetical protein
MGEPNVAIPYCDKPHRDRTLKRNRWPLSALRILAMVALVAAALSALSGRAVLLTERAGDGVGARDIAASVAAVGVGAGIALLFSGAALSAAASLYIRASDYLDEFKESTCNLETSNTVLRRNEGQCSRMVLLTTTFCGTADESGGTDTIRSGWQQHTGPSWEERQGCDWIHAIHSSDRERVLRLGGETLRLNCSTRSAYRLWHTASQEFRFCVSAALPLLSADAQFAQGFLPC